MTRSREKIFIVYSHQDTQWLERLQVHLAPLERQGLIERWDDTRIAPGTSWRGEIRKALENVKVAVLLMARSWPLTSSRITSYLRFWLQAENEGVIILPVIVSPCLFTNVPALARFQAVNLPSKPFLHLARPNKSRLLSRLRMLSSNRYLNAQRVQEAHSSRETCTETSISRHRTLRSCGSLP